MEGYEDNCARLLSVKGQDAISRTCNTGNSDLV